MINLFAPFILLLCFSYGVNDTTIVVDRIHSNIYYGKDKGISKNHQIIFEEWNKTHKCYKVLGWVSNNDVWDKADKEHKKQWQERIIQYCRRRGLNSNHYLSGYRGKFSPGENYPYYNESSGYYVYTFYRSCYDSKTGKTDDKIFRVKSKQFIHTRTNFDPERRNRKIFPARHRPDIFRGHPFEIYRVGKIPDFI